MEYSKVEINQLDQIFSLFSDAIITMENAGIHQWDEIYPDKKILAEDISKNQMYIGKEGDDIAVCFTLSEDCDEEYKTETGNGPKLSFA